jgi:hypothetical protein
MGKPSKIVFINGKGGRGIIVRLRTGLKKKYALCQKAVGKYGSSKLTLINKPFDSSLISSNLDSIQIPKI